MTRSAKHLHAVLLAIFAMAVMGLSAVQVGAMELKTSGIADDMAAAGDCVTPCPGEQYRANGMICPPVCVAPAVAVLPSAMTVVVASAASTFPFTYSPRLGRESLPDPYPPRTRGSV